MTAVLSQRDGVEDVHTDTADNFLRALTPHAEPWRRDPLGWIYRGHANAEWFLRSSAVRNRKAFVDYGYGEVSGWSQRARLVVDTLNRFRSGLDASAVPIPTRPPSVDGAEHNERSSGAEPLREAFPLMALAQHHGLPTLLLDWSRRASVAAYFAASSVLDPTVKEPGERVAVWGLYAKVGDNLYSGSGADPSHMNLEVYQAPAGSNPNLRAQSGVFTLLFGYEDPSVEEFVARGGTNKPVQLRRVTLPRTEARYLLWLLSLEGINGASMFPGADGVVRAMREEALWERREG